MQQIVTKPDYETNQLYVCAVIENAGSAPPSGPMQVNIAILADVYDPGIGWTQEGTQEWRWYDAGTSLPFRTLWTWAPLHYVEDGGGNYQVGVHVGDPENLPGDANPHNNAAYLDYVGPFFKPQTFGPEANETVRLETRMQGGKVTTTLTIGGKPLKNRR